MNRIVAPAILFAWLGLIAASHALADGAAVQVLSVDDSTHSGKLTDLKDGQLVLSGPTTRISLSDVIEVTSSNHAASSAPRGPAHKLTGKVIGTDGSFKGQGSTRDKVFDGNLNTFFDPPEEHRDDAWVGLDLGSPKIITQIKYAPRSRFPRRMIDGKFQGCSSSDFDKDVVTFLTITESPPKNALTSKDVSDSSAFRYVRYIGGQPLSVAEIEFWGRDIGESARPMANASTHSVATTGPSAAPTTLRAVFGEDDLLDAALVDWDDKQLTLKSSLLGDTPIAIPVSTLREVWHGAEAQILKAKAMPLEPGPEDAAFVVKDDGIVVVRGVALGVEGDALKFKFNDQEKKINLSKLVGVILGGQDAKRDHSFRQKIEFADGDSISGRWTAYDANKNVMELQTPWGQALSFRFDAVQKVRSANGRLTYLSDLKPANVEQVPYFDRLMPYRTDHSLTGGTMKLIDGEYQHGIAMHSRCVLTYDLGGSYESFKFKVGFEQPEGKLGQAPIRLLGDGKVLWEDLHARGDATKLPDLSVSVAGIKQLTLEVDFGDNGDTGGRVDWVHPRLLRAKLSP
jgi:hypothetical protein